MHGDFTRHDVDPRHVVRNHATAEAAVDEIIHRWDGGDLRRGSRSVIGPRTARRHGTEHLEHRHDEEQRSRHGPRSAVLTWP
jgi:hypothetical protein